MVEKQKLKDRLGFTESSKHDDLFYKKKDEVWMFVDQREPGDPNIWGTIDGTNNTTDEYKDWSEYKAIKSMIENQKTRDIDADNQEDSDSEVSGSESDSFVFIKLKSGNKYKAKSFDWEYHCAVFVPVDSDHRFSVPRENIRFIERTGDLDG